MRRSTSNYGVNSASMRAARNFKGYIKMGLSGRLPSASVKSKITFSTDTILRIPYFA